MVERALPARRPLGLPNVISYPASPSLPPRLLVLLVLRRRLLGLGQSIALATSREWTKTATPFLHCRYHCIRSSPLWPPSGLAPARSTLHSHGIRNGLFIPCSDESAGPRHVWPIILDDNFRSFAFRLFILTLFRSYIV